jgi:hypothetical protein
MTVGFALSNVCAKVGVVRCETTRWRIEIESGVSYTTIHNEIELKAVPGIFGNSIDSLSVFVGAGESTGQPDGACMDIITPERFPPLRHFHVAILLAETRATRCSRSRVARQNPCQSTGMVYSLPNPNSFQTDPHPMNCGPWFNIVVVETLNVPSVTWSYCQCQYNCYCHSCILARCQHAPSQKTTWFVE